VESMGKELQKTRYELTDIKRNILDKQNQWVAFHNIYKKKMYSIDSILALSKSYRLKNNFKLHYTLPLT
jgi:hypothetical protein